MSEWLHLLNEMKRRPMEEYLTPTQRVAREEICALLRFPNRINLYGPCGSGKTYVAWAVVRATGAAHIPVPEKLQSLERPVEILLIDNAIHYESKVRQLMAQANLLGAESVIFITQQAVELPMHRVQLPLPKSNEVATILAAYARLGFYQQRDIPENPTLWNIMNACV